MKAIYKCRLCGERYTEFHAGRKTAFDFTYAFTESNVYLTESQVKVRAASVHKCKDGSIGFADFQGFKEEDDKK